MPLRHPWTTNSSSAVSNTCSVSRNRSPRETLRRSRQENALPPDRSLRRVSHIGDGELYILHCLGLDHERLTFHHGGRDFRLTEVHGDVVTKILTGSMSLRKS
ncbi:MAG: DUF1501 domain-containing protein [Planctomycetaceae bacterium]